MMSMFSDKFSFDNVSYLIIYLYNKPLVDAQVPRQLVIPVDRARTLAAASHKLSGRRTPRYRVNKQLTYVRRSYEPCSSQFIMLEF